MQFKVNEKIVNSRINLSLSEIKEQYKKEADVVILNGYPMDLDNLNRTIKDGDKISLIKKGERLDKNEIEKVLLARHSPEVHSKVKNAIIGIGGLGGLGSNIAIMLARIGIGKIVIADYDIVEPSNLNRQNYAISHLGMKKTEAIIEQIKEINPFIKIEDYCKEIDENNAVDIFEECSIVIEAFDRPEAKANLVNSILLNTDKRVIASSGMAGYFSSNSIMSKRINSRFFLCGDGENEAKIGSGLMAPRVLICAGHMANQTLRLIMGEEVV